MERLQRLIVFLALLALTCGQLQEHEGLTIKPHPPPITTSTTTTTTEKPTKPTTTATTTKPTIPPITTTSTTTEKPSTTTTTTEKPTTTTTKTTTTTTTSTTTSPPSTTTTSPPPTPKPEPPKNIDPTPGDWKINNTGNGTSDFCIFAHMAIQIEVLYETKSNKTWTAFVDVPANATAIGNCGDALESLTLQWPASNITFNFEKINKTYALKTVSLQIAKDDVNFPDAIDKEPLKLVADLEVFNITEKMSYKCPKLQSFNLTVANTTIAMLRVSHMQLQAFADGKSSNFADAVNCEPPSTPDIVPIAAGCALAALIIVVLGAYLFGRRRAQSRGYHSMFTENKREEDYIPMKNLSCFN